MQNDAVYTELKCRMTSSAVEISVYGSLQNKVYDMFENGRGCDLSCKIRENNQFALTCDRQLLQMSGRTGATGPGGRGGGGPVGIPVSNECWSAVK